MSGISWEDLMRFGLCDLRLSPEVFWELTPVELMMMAGQNRAKDASLGRGGFEALMKRFPDMKAD